MKAWRVHAWGEPETMRLEEIADPAPGLGQAKIRNHAAALNFFDILQVQGKYQIKPPFPFTPGAEVAGVVDAVGDGVTSLRPGDRVMAMPHGGGFAEVSIAPASSVFAIPAGMSFEEAAAIPIVYHTSYFAFTHRTQLCRGEWLVVHAGASGVGMSAIQIGKALGARVIATAGSESKCAFAAAQGADQVLDYSDSNWVDRVKEFTGRGAERHLRPRRRRRFRPFDQMHRAGGPAPGDRLRQRTHSLHRRESNSVKKYVGGRGVVGRLCAEPSRISRARSHGVDGNV